MFHRLERFPRVILLSSLVILSHLSGSKTRTCSCHEIVTECDGRYSTCNATFVKFNTTELDRNYHLYPRPCSSRAHRTSFVKDSLEVDVSYRSRSDAIVSIQWRYQNILTNESRVEITVIQNKVANFFCLPTSIDQLIVQLAVPVSSAHCRPTGYSVPEVNFSAKVSVESLDSFSQVNTVVLSKVVTIHDCWNSTGNQSLIICGPQVPSGPRSVSATFLASSRNVTAVRICWSPPLHHNTPVVSYYVQLKSYMLTKLTEELLEMKLADIFVAKNESCVTLECNKSWIKNSEIKAEVQAGVEEYEKNISKLFCQNATGGIIYGEISSIRLNWPTTPHSTVLTPTDPEVKFNQSFEVSQDPSGAREFTTAVILIVSVGTFLTFIALVKTVSRLRLCHPQGSFPQLQASVHSASNQEVKKETSFDASQSLLVPPSVFLVASTEDCEESKYKIRYLAQELAGHGIIPIYYEYQLNTEANSPSILGIPAWVELNFKECNFVLFVCTTRFVQEWSAASPIEETTGLVRSARHALEGVIPCEDDISKFAVLFMGGKCEIPLTLKRLQVFVLYKENSDVIFSEDLIRYLLDAPQFAPPMQT